MGKPSRGTSFYIVKYTHGHFEVTVILFNHLYCTGRRVAPESFDLSHCSFLRITAPPFLVSADILVQNLGTGKGWANEAATSMVACCKEDG